MKSLTKYFRLLMFLLLLIFPTYVLAEPYWARPGVYIEYIAQRYDPYFDLVRGGTPDQIHTAEVFLDVNGTLFMISASSNTTVRFDILDKKEGYLKVRAIIEMENVTISSIFLNGTQYPVFWDSESIMSKKLLPSHDAGFRDCVWLEVKLDKIQISGTYLIRLSDGAVFDMDGNYYGHTFLWIDPNNSLKVNETFSVMGNTNVTIWAVGTFNESVMTYYGQFGPPLISVMVTTGDFELSQKVDKKRRYSLFEVSFNGPSAGIIYDPSTGIAVYPAVIGTAPYADFYAIGIRWAVFEDQLSGYQMLAKKDSSWKFGLVLYDTNADFGAVETVEYPRPKTPMGYIFYGILSLLGAVVIWSMAERRR
ncbi:hypothetical protein E3E36_00210 [Thermococcus sp. M36]|uniref:hypothetical protein n=1 Tax=Thermococcus sp. M36 TaxID=1638261 RepID=UPI0014396082|nr:hypothetical protein [Thermococcus sp. M36]NJE04595.1 hypothetical protein [Thermococcus sp. M36]